MNRGKLDWPRLLGRFDGPWRVLLNHLVLFGFIYPSEQGVVPEWVMHELLRRLQDEVNSPPPRNRICQGTLLSRTQYHPDVERLGYRDVRLFTGGSMLPDDLPTPFETAEIR